MTKVSHDCKGKIVEVDCECPLYLAGEELSAAGAAYVGSVVANLAAARSLATQELLETYNDCWVDETHLPLTAEAFQKNLIKPRFSILDEACCSIYFADSDMFGGHIIEVAFEGDRPTWAQLLG